MAQLPAPPLPASGWVLNFSRLPATPRRPVVLRVAARLAASPGLANSRPRRAREGYWPRGVDLGSGGRGSRLLTSPSLGIWPTREARSLPAVRSCPRGRGLGAPGGSACPPQPAPHEAKRSALRLHWPCTPPPSPALQGRAHPLLLPAVGGLASQLKPVSHPSPAPATHPALATHPAFLQVSTDQNRIQRGLRFPSPRRRDTRRCPLSFDHREGWTPGSAPQSLFAPSCQS